jgi:hypothetical protein
LVPRSLYIQAVNQSFRTALRKNRNTEQP